MKIVTLSEPLLAAAAIVLVAGLLLAQTRSRRVTMRRLWIVAGGIVILSGVLLSLRPPQSSDWPWLAAAGLAGLVVGATRAALTSIRGIDASGAIDVQNSRLGVLVWCAALVGRVVLRQVVGRSDPDAAAVSLATASLLLFAVGNVLANTATLQRAARQARARLAW